MDELSFVVAQINDVFSCLKSLLRSQSFPKRINRLTDEYFDIVASVFYIHNIHILLLHRSTAKPAATELINKEVKKKKKKRKSKLPKNYDPNVDPDPNRWLPKHERTGVKKRRDRRIVKDSGIGKGTQGTASTSSDQ